MGKMIGRYHQSNHKILRGQTYLRVYSHRTVEFVQTFLTYVLI